MKCKGSVTITDNDEIVAEVDHEKHEPLTEKEIVVLKWKILVKARCESESTTACKIHNEEQAGLVNKHNFTNAEVAQLAPSFRRTLRNRV